MLHKHGPLNPLDGKRAGPGQSLMGTQVKEDFPGEVLFDLNERMGAGRKTRRRRSTLPKAEAQKAPQGAPVRGSLPVTRATTGFPTPGEHKKLLSISVCIPITLCTP